MSAAVKTLKKPPSSALAAAWIVLIIARLVLFDEGGSLGAYVTVIAFWLVSAVLAAQAVVLIGNGEGRKEHSLVVLALTAFFLPQVFGQGLASKICFVIFFVAAVSLLVLYVNRLRRHSHGRPAVGQ